jgi:hypothetical protein
MLIADLSRDGGLREVQKSRASQSAFNIQPSAFSIQHSAISNQQ